ncbi:hypothetical protein DO71_5395 [Burkholderia pseudomallei]|nr:hypothetical protein DO71_5395 [Burkholderia pseudomallei]KGD41376.1 hypothetical protein DO72_4686 [Burkholderia pseudomallei]
MVTEAAQVAGFGEDTFQQVGHLGFLRRMVNGQPKGCPLPLMADILHVLRAGVRW